MKRILLLSIVLFSLIILTSCSDYSYDDAEIIIGDDIINVEVANDKEETETGMMYRKYLGRNQGMFFVFPYEDHKTFWMKNTLIPLDIIFINSRYEIVMIHEATPCKTENCAYYYSNKPAQYVLEVNQGYSEKHGIKIGDKIELGKTNPNR